MHALTFFREWSTPHIYLGATDIDVEGEWIMMNGASFNEIKKRPELSYMWISGEPNDHGTGEDCMQIAPNQSVNDAKCSKTNSRGLCEKKTISCSGDK